MNLEKEVIDYLYYDKYQKKLDDKTIKAYQIDLNQFISFMRQFDFEINKHSLTSYITELHKLYKPRTVKRKIACIKAFFNYLEYEELLEFNPFDKIRTKFKEPSILPRTIPLNIIQTILDCTYRELRSNAYTEFKHKSIHRDVAVLELLFATGIRVSELCSLKHTDINLEDGSIKIFGKGAKERLVQIGNDDVLAVLREYRELFWNDILKCGYFFVNKRGQRLSEQSIRFMINKYVDMCGISIHITPHMFRHSFATFLLEEDVDIRYIQQLLGHSSIVTTQIYTHVAMQKQRDILTEKHPRNRLVVNGG